jgi:hypothetical protein
MKKLFLPVVLLVGLAACESITPAETALGTCESYTAALNSVTVEVKKDNIKPKGIEAVREANRITEPYCGANSVPPAVDATTASVAIDAGIAILQGVLTSNLIH